VLDRLPYVYAALLVLEGVALAALYATAPPLPSDPLSVALGWGAIGSMSVLLVYSVARRSRALRNVARLTYWLHFHIFLALQGVMWALFHASSVVRKEHVAWLNPGLLTTFAVLVVFSSGLFGRYVYSWLPRAIGGEQILLADLDPAQRTAAIQTAQRVFGIWIFLHRPLAGVLYVLCVMHIVLSYMYSASL
jgi:hypothetical protein